MPTAVLSPRPTSSAAASVVSKKGGVPCSDTLSRLINLAGRQRMLSQRLILFVVLAGGGRASALSTAEEVLNQFRSSHLLLVQGGDGLPGLFSHNLRQTFDGASQARTRIEAFIDSLERTIRGLRRGEPLSEATQSALVDTSSDLLGVLTHITQAYEQEARQLSKAQQAQRVRLNEEIQSVAREARVVAFNAQVSAYRAGPEGREFAVVAARMATITEEVEQLVRASMNSA
ncbi:MAG TPA: type IV pili methyl-accepting chemotaxis transducer N-terminal domain-containing protein [Aquabacterium sp.]|nr:type IV pili methyl-accepting chemotaxis transducer N-terminal domain-containing protein [Aquabacterium sp.]